MKAVLPGPEVFLLNAVEDGAVQIVSVLKRYSDLASVQLLADDLPGLLEIGLGPPVGCGYLSQSASLWAALASSIAEGGDLLFLGCALGSGSETDAIPAVGFRVALGAVVSNRGR